MYLLRGVDGNGDPVDLPIVVCWRCGGPVMTSLVSMTEHVDRMHPVAPGTAAVGPELPHPQPEAPREPVIAMPSPREPVDWWEPATRRSP